MLDGGGQEKGEGQCCWEESRNRERGQCFWEEGRNREKWQVLLEGRQE